MHRSGKPSIYHKKCHTVPLPRARAAEEQLPSALRDILLGLQNRFVFFPPPVTTAESDLNGSIASTPSYPQHTGKGFAFIFFSSFHSVKYIQRTRKLEAGG